MLASLIAQLRAAKTPKDLKLDLPPFRVTRGRIGNMDFTPLEVRPGPVKAKDRAWAKVAGWPNGLSQWPPALAEMTDIIRATVLCSGPF